ncbi:hypothetical protein NMY22_g7307 [Coprinellus aureogranulatus]|nr:hypothetical protein NMY22_g7307 [Coprinellus aureogranulatus]
MMLGRWDGQVLEIVACPFLTDGFIRRMQRGEAIRLELLFPDLRFLRIVDCPNFSPVALLSFLDDWLRTFVQASPQRYSGSNGYGRNREMLASLEVAGQSPRLDDPRLVNWTMAVASSVAWETTESRTAEVQHGRSPSPASLLREYTPQKMPCDCLPCAVADVFLDPIPKGLLS